MRSYGKDAFGAVLLSVDGERDALVQKRQIRGGLPLFQLEGVERQQALEQGGVLRPRQALRVEHLVVRVVEMVGPERRQLGQRAGSGAWGNRHGQELEGGLVAVKPRIEVVSHLRGLLYTGASHGL